MGEDTRHPEPPAHEQPADDPDLGLALITARALAPLLLDDASRDNLVGILPPAWTPMEQQFTQMARPEG
jgi:hypothetical protein